MDASHRVRATLSLTRVLGHLERQLSRRLDDILVSEGITVDQWRVLELLADGAGRPMSSIAAHISVPGPTLTKLTDRLVDASLVYRRVGEADRRRVLVFLADRGHQVYQRLSPRVARVERELLDVLGVEAGVVLELLVRLAEPTLPTLGQSGVS